MPLANNIALKAIKSYDIREFLKREEISPNCLLKIGKASLNEEGFRRLVEKLEWPSNFPYGEEEMINALLSGVMNAEPKQIMTMILDKNPKNLDEIIHEFRELTHGVWEDKRIIGFKYYVPQLDILGILSYSVDEDKVKYKITAPGKFYAQPCAAFALDLANKLGLSFYKIFGRSRSKKENAPYNRFRIMEILLDGEKRNKDLSRELGITMSSARGNLIALKKIGFIEYDSSNPDEPGWAVYELVEDTNLDLSKTSELAKDVIKLLYDKGKADRNEIVKYLMKKSHLKEETLKQKVSGILSQLERNGHAKAKLKGQFKHSSIKLTQKGREFIEEFSKNMRNAVNYGERLNYMKEILNQYRRDRKLFELHATHGIKLYMDAIPQFDGSNVLENMILDYISKVGKARPKDITKYIGKRVDKHLTNMVEDGTLTKRKEGRAAYYELSK